MAEQDALSRNHAHLPPIHLDAVVNLAVVEEAGSGGGAGEHEAWPRVHEDGELPLLVTAEEGVPDEVEREAVARDEEEGDPGVPGRQRRLLHLRQGLLHPPRSPRGRRLLLLRRLQGRGRVVQQQDEEAAQAEAQQQQDRQQQQRRRAPAPTVAEPPRLHPQERGG
uniref:Uncharacterized protein n=1 Tax=Arundo donax TaxID=35708 RepID=A0A0A9EAL7_ARUDO